MGTVSATFLSSGAIVQGPVAGVPCIVDVCSAGKPGQLYTFVTGSLVTDQIGGGRGADLVLAALSNGVPLVYFSPATPTWSALPSVAHVGTGPTMTASLVPGASGPMESYGIVVTIGSGQTMSVAYDCPNGSLTGTIVDTLPIPNESSASLTGTVPLTPTALALLSGLTLVFVTPAVETITFASPSLAGAPAGLMAATATVTGGASYTSSNYLAPGVAALAANPRKLRWTTAGATAAHVPAAIALTGFDYANNALSETIVPSTTAGDVISVHAYASFSWSYTSAGGTDATLAVGYEAAYATNAELVAEFNALALAAPLTVSAVAVQSSTGTYLQIYTNLATSGAGGTGLSATISLNSSDGTAGPVLGFANSASSTGLAATFAPPWTNVVLTFPVGTYAAGDTYSLPCVGPEASVSAATAAVAYAISQWQTNPYGFIAVTAGPSSAANAVALQAGCTALTNASRASNAAPVLCFTGTSLWATSQTAATNQAAITANDNALVNAFNGAPAALDAVVPGDCYVTGSSSLRAGLFRRHAVFAALIKAATLPSLGQNLGNGVAQGTSLRAADLLTLARDENTAVTKLGPVGMSGNTGLGFCVLQSSPGANGLGNPKFPSGVTRAGSGSYFRSVGLMFVMLAISANEYALVFGWVGQNWPTSKVPATLGQIKPQYAAQRSSILTKSLAPMLTPAQGPAAVSDYGVTINTSGNFQSVGLVPVVTTVQPLGEVFNVTLTMVASASVPNTLTGSGPAPTSL